MLTISSSNPSYSRSASPRRWLLRHLLPAALAFLFCLPLLWLMVSSLREPGQQPSASLQGWPNPPSWSNYVSIFQQFPIGQPLLNSILVVVFAVPATLITTSWAGLAMAHLSPRPRRALVMLTVLLMIIPLPALWLPRFVLYTAVGLNDSLLSLILPALMGTSPFFVLLFYWTFHRLPRELFEAAQLDGATYAQLWRFVALPLAKPTLAVVSVLAFTLYWSDYISPLMYLRTESLYTYSLRLQMFTQQSATVQPLAMAATIVAIVPVVGLFLLVQRYFWPEGRGGNIER